MNHSTRPSLTYALLTLLVLAVFYGIYFAKALLQNGAAFRRGRSAAGRKKAFIPSSC